MKNMEPQLMLALTGVHPNDGLPSSQQAICLPPPVFLRIDAPTCHEFVRVALPGNSYCISRVTAIENVSPVARSDTPPHCHVYPAITSLSVSAGSWSGSSHLVSLQDVQLLKKSAIHSVCVTAYLNSPKSLQRCKKHPSLFLKEIEEIISLYGVTAGCILKCQHNKLAQMCGVNALQFHSLIGTSKHNNSLEKIDLTSNSVGYKFEKDTSKCIYNRESCECGWTKCNTDELPGNFHVSNGRITLCSVEVSEPATTAPNPSQSVETVMVEEAAVLQNLLFKSCTSLVKAPPLLLLTGLPGCGKSTLLRCATASSGAPLTALDCSSLKLDSFSSAFSRVLEELPSQRPCVLQLRRLDLLFSEEKKPQTLLCKVMLSLRRVRAANVAVVITAPSRSALPAQLAARATRELSVGASTVPYRYAMLCSLLEQSALLDVLQPPHPAPNGGGLHLAPVHAEGGAVPHGAERLARTTSDSAEETQRGVCAVSTPSSGACAVDGVVSALASEMAGLTPGFVAKDLKDLIFLVESKLLKKARVRGQVAAATAAVAVREELRTMKPAVLRSSDLLGECPRVCALAGLQHLQEELRGILEVAKTGSDSLKCFGLTPTRGVLLYGPPGCGKTQLMCSLAASHGFTFYAVQPKSVLSPYVGESEQKLMKVFQTARMTKPSIIFFDEIDGLFGDRSDSGSEASKRLVTELLQVLDGASAYRDGSDIMEGLVLCGATNNPDRMDPALLRPGRFDRAIYVPPPDAAQRLQILQTKCRKLSLEDPEVLAELAKKTEHFTGADLEGVVQQATTEALLEESLSAVGDVLVPSVALRRACAATRPKVTPELLRRYWLFQSNSPAA